MNKKERIVQIILVVIIVFIIGSTIYIKMNKNNDNSVKEIAEEKILLDISDYNDIEIGKENNYSFTINNNYEKTLYLDINIEYDSMYKDKIYYQTTINNVKLDKQLLTDNVFSNYILKDKEYKINIEFFKDEELDDNVVISGKFKFSNKIINNLASEYIINNAELTKLNSNYEVTNDNTDVLEYRYTGSNPNNYVWFNCADGYNNSETYCERWRIVGVFSKSKVNNGYKYQRLYLVKDKPLNIEMTRNDFLNYLNTKYYNSLNSDYKLMIMNSTYNMGLINLDKTVIENYKSELTNQKILTLSTINISDLGFASDAKYYNEKIYNVDAVSNSWLGNKNYFFSGMDSNNNIYKLENNIISSINDDNAYYMIPSLYLNPLVLIDGGNGTKESPYILKLNNYVDYF